jgi:hypothetical protein
MPIRIGDGIMQLEIDGRVVATATERSGGWWEVMYWQWFFNRNQAITALTVTELLESSRDSNAPLVAALRQELLTGPLIRLTVTAPVAGAPGAIALIGLARSRQT